MSNQQKTDVRVVLVGHGRSLPVATHLLLSLEILSRDIVLPYQAERGKKSRKAMLDMRRNESFTALDDTPMAVTAAIQEEIADRVKADADKFVSAKATSIAPLRTGFAPVRRHRDTIHFKPNRYGMNSANASDVARATEMSQAVAQSLSK